MASPDSRPTPDPAAFEAERPRLTHLATRMLGDAAEAEDVVQRAWLRWHDHADVRDDVAPIENLPGWLTTVTTRLCLDRLRQRVPAPMDPAEHPGLTEPDRGATAPVDPADAIALADTVGLALEVVLSRLSPAERVAFVLHDSFGFDFATIASVLDTSDAAARKLASRARAKIGQPTPEDRLADWEIVDAFLAAAREGDFARLLDLLAPDSVIGADAAAVLMGTPERIEGRDEVAAFFNGAASAAFASFVDGRPGAAWINRGEAKVAFDFTIVDGRVASIVFRAEPALLATVRRR
ncbi:sigma-70 family RNA polymerase sigma factor [Nocardioides sp. R-C-SC26]|uniref:sigma-70 family RNA polymerase sigma factor n=1 Tax=Nocardioides sp. R-C-SC26 TaxID=2870414 RepID=UPI001E495974|nr:sigma-70 family RNA polymerase sigma factor [Nocardioides sp. R-C-SC26]